MAPAADRTGCARAALRDFLGGFDFRGDRVERAGGEFSGGEKARLTLALLVRQRPNLLLLDEPTNHLDIDMREALTEALQDYTGALIVVAHDRHLLRATADELWLVADGALSRSSTVIWTITGNGCWPVAGARLRPLLTPHRPLLTARPRGAPKRPHDSACRSCASRCSRRSNASSSGSICCRRKNAELDEWLATSEAYIEDNKERLIASLARQGDLAWQLARDEAEWLELHEALERAGD